MLTAYALGELSPRERALVELELSQDLEKQQEAEEIRKLASGLTADLLAEPCPHLTPAQQKEVLRRNPLREGQTESGQRVTLNRWQFWLSTGAVAGAACLVTMWLGSKLRESQPASARPSQVAQQMSPDQTRNQPNQTTALPIQGTRTVAGSPPESLPQEPRVPTETNRPIPLASTPTAQAPNAFASNVALPATPADLALVPLEIRLPVPAFLGSPVDLIGGDRIEPPSDRPRPPFYVPVGVVNLALGRPVTCSDRNPIAGSPRLVTDGNEKGMCQARKPGRQTPRHGRSAGPICAPLYYSKGSTFSALNRYTEVEVYGLAGW